MSVWFILSCAQLFALLCQHPRRCESVSRWSHGHTVNDAPMSAVYFHSKMLIRNFNCTPLTLVSCHLDLGVAMVGWGPAQSSYCVVQWSTQTTIKSFVSWLAVLYTVSRYLRHLSCELCVCLVRVVCVCCALRIVVSYWAVSHNWYMVPGKVTK